MTAFGAVAWGIEQGFSAWKPPYDYVHKAADATAQDERKGAEEPKH